MPVCGPLKNNCNSSPGAPNLTSPRPVKGYQCFIFVHLGLRSIAPLFEKAKMDEDEVLVNFYE